MAHVYSVPLEEEANSCVRALVVAQSEDIAVKARRSFPAAGLDGAVVEGDDPDGPAALAQPHTNE